MAPAGPSCYPDASGFESGDLYDVTLVGNDWGGAQGTVSTASTL